MIYNTIHNRYDLPLGLQFSLHFNKVEYPNKWISISNIPALDHFVYEGIETKEEVLKIIEFLFDNVYFLDKNINLLEPHLNHPVIYLNHKKTIDKIINKYNNQQYTITKPLNEV